MHHIRASILSVLLMTIMVSASAAVIDVAQKPVFLNPPDPRVMLVVSRDHELSKKAYNDHSDLNGNGVLEITYADTIDYYGYFDPKKCYTYNSTGVSSTSSSNNNGRFDPAVAATGLNSHDCSAKWSGNFLNWVSMTRMDVLRKTLYGGLRSIDNNGTALGDTVLERVLLPNDVHAFNKVYAPAGGATDMAKYTPYSNPVMSFCNVTLGTGMSRASNAPPIIQVATGAYPRWAMTESTQCGTGATDKPGSLTDTLIARVAVCAPGLLESTCTLYGATNLKPTGLLQQYGEKEALARVQFGLLTGSYSKNKSGGVLRKNTSWLTNNTTSTDDEIDSATGRFINQTTTSTGIINTINRIRISGWDYSSSPPKHQNNCNVPGILTFADGECVDWGNPLAEMYLETLRYFAGMTTPTPAFDTTSAEQTHLPSLPKVSWTDPLPSGQWCALSNIIVLSTGLNSFDGDQLTGHGITGLNATTLTNSVGTAESVSGTYLIGSNGVISDNQCSSKTLTNLSSASGICPEVPSLQGTYNLAGLAYANQTVDLRPGYLPQRNVRWGSTSPNPNPDLAARQPMSTFTVALAESLPSFAVPVTGGTVTFLPACQANSNGAATAATTGWRVCSLTDLRITNLVTNGSGQPVSGDFEAVWEDSTWGNDYDMDGIQTISFTVVGTQLQLSTQVTHTAAGHAMRFGYTVTGSSADGTSFPVLIAGGANVNTATPAVAVASPFTPGASAAKLLESPLWYAAKYAHVQPVGATQPDNFFKVTNPAGLYGALGTVFEAAANSDASASAIASNSTRLDTNTHIYQAILHSPAWTGELKSIPLGAGGVPGVQTWEAGAIMTAAGASGRNIKTWNGQTWSTGGGGLDFNWATLTSTQQTDIGSSAMLDYLRGVQTNERPAGTYRKRLSLLGDIVNSDPHYVSTENYGYDLLASALAAAEKTAYTTFVAGKTTRMQMLYVGANDGMLHAFNAADGSEKFAYVPNGVIPNLNKLSSPTYQHIYFVDGSPNSGDAYLNGAWKTVLLGTLGAGGKSVFALDITAPDTAFTTGNVMWEFKDATDLGFVMSRAFVARMRDGNWYAIFGNGYNSPSGHAVLFAVPLDPALGSVHKIDVGAATGTTNGLSEPALLDTDGDGVIDTIYAGDLNGNIWKFDMSATNANSWGSAYPTSPNAAAVPLFNATVGVAQPITGPLEIGSPPNGTSGNMIYFGTGKYLGSSDVGNTATQTAYGILDSGTVITGRSQLQAQTFTYEGVRSITDSSKIRLLSNTSFSYTGGSAKRGWYLDLLSPNSPSNLGERVISTPLLRYGRAIFTSIIPSAGPCEQGGYSWITEIDALTGGRLTYSVFDYDGDGTFNSDDNATSGSGNSATSNPVSSRQLRSEGLMKSPTVISAGEKEYKVGSGTAGGIVVITEKGDTGAPRTSWRQIFQP